MEFSASLPADMARKGLLHMLYVRCGLIITVKLQRHTEFTDRDKIFTDESCE